MTLLDELKRDCHRLSRDEKQRLRDYLSMLLGTGSKSVAEKANKGATIERDTALILETIADVCRDRGIEMEGKHAAMLKVHPAFPAFAEKCDMLKSYIDRSCDRSRVAKLAFIRLAVELLVTNLQQMRVPISASVVMNHVHRLPAVMDQNFPGYAKSGLLGMVIRERGQ